MKHSGALRVLDTFSGAGGFSLGFHLAGCHVVGGIEIDQWAANTFSANHSDAKALCTAIEGLSDDALKSCFSGDLMPHIILGGPPCQGFSRCLRNAGDQRDPRNSLFYEFIRAAYLFDPKLLVMENVPWLLKAKTPTGTAVIIIIERELRALGYHVYYQILHATDFGIPQIRQRLFVVGSKSPLKAPFPQPTHFWSKHNPAQLELGLRNGLKPCPTLWDAISDLPEIDAREGAAVLDYVNPPQTEYQETLREGSEKVFNHTAMRHSKTVSGKIFRDEVWRYAIECSRRASSSTEIRKWGNLWQRL